MSDDISIGNISQLRGQRKSINPDKYSNKLKQLRQGQVKVNPSVEASYKEIYGSDHSSVNANIDQIGRAHMDNITPDVKQQSSTPSTQTYPTIKLGAIIKFEDDKGDLEISRDEQGFEYNYDGFVVSSLEFAKGDNAPPERKFKADQLYSVSDVSIDLTDIADTFEKGDTLQFKIEKVKSFYQRHASSSLSSNFEVEVELKTDLGIDIPAKIALKAHPLAKDLLDYTVQGVAIAAQIEEITSAINS